MKTIFLGSNLIKFGRNKGSKDKKKRVINNDPRAEGQAPLSSVGQQRIGHKYLRKRDALKSLGITSTLGAIAGTALGSTAGAIIRKPKQGGAIGAGIGALGLGGLSLLEHAKNKHSPFYQKNLFKKK